MTWPRFLEICEYWQRVPPLAETVAGFTGALGNSTTGSAPGRHELVPADDSTDLVKDLIAAGFTLPQGFGG